MTHEIVPSRRALVKGAAWAVPTVAVASVAPAFAASNTCGKLSWANATKGSTSVGGAKLTSTDQGLFKGAVATLPATANQFYYSDGTGAKQNCVFTGDPSNPAEVADPKKYSCSPDPTTNFAGGSVVDGKLAIRAFRNETNVNNAANDYYPTTITFPAPTTNALSFTIDGIDNYFTKSMGFDQYGFGFFKDQIQVLADGKVINPVSSTGVNTGGGFVTAVEQNDGSAVYTVPAGVKTIEIRLYNAFDNLDAFANSGEVVQRQTQTIFVSDLVCLGTPQATPPFVQPPVVQGANFKSGMFVTVEANGYGYDSGNNTPSGPIEQVETSGASGIHAIDDVNWSDANGYPTIPIGGASASNTQSGSIDVVNRQGTYTPGGTGFKPEEYRGTGMWLSSPVDSSGNGVVGTTILKAGATFSLAVKVVADLANGTLVNKWDGYSSLNQGHNIGVVGDRLSYSASPVSLMWEPWQEVPGSGPDQGLFVGTGIVHLTTQRDIVVQSTDGTIKYNQLILNPAFHTYQGLGNGILLYCSTLSYESGTIRVFTGGVSTDVTTVPSNLQPTTSYVRAQEDQARRSSTGNLIYANKPYVGTC